MIIGMAAKVNKRINTAEEINNAIGNSLFLNVNDLNFKAKSGSSATSK